MLILWRACLIFLCCIAVMICYPYCTDKALTIMYTWAGMAFVIVIFLTWLSKILIVGKSHIFNTIFDMAIIIGFLYVLLNIFPQLDGQTPYKRLKKGRYPTLQEIDVGLANFGFTTRKETIKELQNNFDEIKGNVNEVKTLILKEHND